MKQTLILSFFICFCIPAFADDNRPAFEDSAYQTRKKFDYFFLESLRLKQNERYGEAFAALQHALKIDSTSSAALSSLANYYMVLEQDSLAIDASRKAVKYSPKNYEYKITLADLYREKGKFAEATRLYEDLVAEQPEKPELHFFLSDLYLKQNQIDKAVQSLDALENTIGMSEALFMQKYKLYLAMEQTDNAVNELEKLAAKYPTEAKYQILIGDFYLDRNNSDKALTYYEKARVINPKSPYYVISMANYYEKTGNTDAAVNEIKIALNNPDVDSDTKIAILGKFIGNRLSDKKDIDSAYSLFQTLMEQYSQDTDINMMYGQFLLSQEKWDDARLQFQTVTEVDPENLLAWRLLMNIAAKEDKPDEVIRICDSALAVFPDNYKFYLNKGLAYNQLKNYPEALSAFTKGIAYISENERNPFSDFYGLIGEVYHEMNKKEEAYKSYDKALEYNEKNISVLNNYAYFLSLDKEQLDMAERMSGKCVQMQPNEPTYIDTYAWVFFQKGNYSLAKFYIESAISKGGYKSPDILEHYGDILYKTGNTNEAVVQWEKALKAKGEDEDTKLLKKKIKDKTYYEAK